MNNMAKALRDMGAAELRRTADKANFTFSQELAALPVKYGNLTISDMRRIAAPEFAAYLTAVDWASAVAEEMKRREVYSGTLKPIKQNPTPRIKKSRLSSQPSQLTRDDPSPRLVKRRKATNKQAMPGVWANPLTRVKVTSESQRGAPFTPRLKARRQTTKKAPPGFYANPAPSNARPYLGVEMLEREGLEYGLDAVTPVSWTFTTKKGGTARASYSYSLPADLVKSREFQTWARAAGGRVIMSLKSLKATLKAMQS